MAIALVSGQVASAINSGGSATTLNVVLPNNPTSGNFVVVCFAYLSGTLPTGFTVADSNSNSYTATTKSPFTTTQAGSGKIGIYYLLSTPANATKTITVTRLGSGSAGTNSFNIWAAEFSGVKTSAALENDASVNNSGSSTTINTPSITSTNDGDLYIGVCLAGQTISAAGSPFALISTVQNGNAAEYYVQPTHGARAAAYTQSPTGVWDGLLAAFIAATGGGTGKLKYFGMAKLDGITTGGPFFANPI